jgi:hypothetical protein
VQAVDVQNFRGLRNEIHIRSVHGLICILNGHYTGSVNGVMFLSTGSYLLDDVGNRFENLEL